MTNPASTRPRVSAVGAQFELSDEQLQIIQHLIACHGKVLSVAGSGKTTTTAERIAYFASELGFPPERFSP